MEIAEALSDALSDALNRLAELTAERDRLTTEIEDVTTEVNGLRLALERRHTTPPDGPADTTNPFLSYARTDAILTVLDLEVPMSPTDVVGQLHRLGRNDNYSAVSAAMAYLARIGKVRSEGRGKWLLVDKVDSGQFSLLDTRDEF